MTGEPSTGAADPAGFDADLAACGVSERSLAAADREALDRDGFVVLTGLLEPATLERVRSIFPAARGTGTRHVPDAAMQGVEVAMAAAHPAVLAAVRHVLGRPFHLFHFSGRDPSPGYGRQGFHTDWVARAPDDSYSVATVLWMLDDFRRDNGTTRVVPGSHRLPGEIPRELAAPDARHPREILVVGPAGSALVFNGHLWHGATRNDSPLPRRTLQIQYVAADRAAPNAPRPALPDEIPAAARRVLAG